MNILHAFTRKSLRANKTRTLVTIIGIVLSMSLFTAVIEGAYSGQQFLVRSVEEVEGRWMVLESGLDLEQADRARHTYGVAESALWQEVGWGLIGTENEYKPYLLVESMEPGLEDLLSIRLLSGRLPENGDELLLPAHLSSNGGVLLREGEELTIALGRRTDETGTSLLPDRMLDPEVPETLRDAEEHTYRIVGVYERFGLDIESYGSPGYTALTRSAPAKGSYTVFYTLKNPSRTLRWLEAHPAAGQRAVHNDLRRFYGSFGSDTFNTLIYSFAGILTALILFGSVSLIYNSFSISVSERTRQFGIMKSVGATRKQIRASVLYEALLLSLVGIPAGMLVGCAGIGITLYCLRGAFAGLLFTGATTQMRLVLSSAPLGIAAAICLVTTLISAAIPARRAVRIAPIDSIRQTADIRLNARQVRTGVLTRKLFGFEGMLAVKNFKRNRKRYRSTVVSLFLSVVLFISASSFCSYLRDTARDVTAGQMSQADITYYTGGYQKPDPETVLAMLIQAGDAQEGVYQDFEGKDVFISRDLIAPEARRWLSDSPEVGSGEVDTVAYLSFVRDETFQALCVANGFSPDDFFDPERPLALVSNQVRRQMVDENGLRTARYTMLETSVFPCAVGAWEPAEREGYIYNGFATGEDGERRYSYVPLGEDGTPVWDAPELLPPEEAGTAVEYRLAGTVEIFPFGLSSDQFTIFYPFSQEAAVLGEDSLAFQTSFSFRTSDHAQAFTAMKAALVDAGMDSSRLFDAAAEEETVRMLVTAVNVFAYGFIILISLIAVANVFNTITTNVLMRRREIAMLRSIGMDQRGERRMMHFECIIYGARGLLWGIPAALGVTWVIWRAVDNAVERSFYIPWTSVAVAVGSVFAVVFATMLYASARLRRDNPIDALKSENL